jgi:hypothetical protein
MSTIGAYRGDDNPGTVFVFARPSAPGGHFAALRVGGVWKPAVRTVGELEEGYTRITDASEVASLLSMARAVLDPEEAIDRHSFRVLRELAEERKKRPPA